MSLFYTPFHVLQTARWALKQRSLFQKAEASDNGKLLGVAAAHREEADNPYYFNNNNADSTGDRNNECPAQNQRDQYEQCVGYAEL